jgi:hypothetical protein
LRSFCVRHFLNLLRWGLNILHLNLLGFELVCSNLMGSWLMIFEVMEQFETFAATTVVTLKESQIHLMEKVKGCRVLTCFNKWVVRFFIVLSDLEQPKNGHTLRLEFLSYRKIYYTGIKLTTEIKMFYISRGI